MFDDMDKVRTDVERRLAQGANDRNAAMHTPVVVTGDADARIMVLRDFDVAGWTLRFYTDARAPKADVIGDGAAVGVLFYDRDAKVQIRCRGIGRVKREGSAVDAAWSASNNFARRCYLGAAPGALSDVPTSGLPRAVEGVEPTDEELIPARENFALLLVRIEQIDWFHLDHHGHRRAILTDHSGQWVAP